MDAYVGAAVLVVAALVQLIKYVIPASTREFAITKLVIFSAVMALSYIAAGIIGTNLRVPPVDLISSEVFEMARAIFLGAVALYDGTKIFYRVGKEYR